MALDETQARAKSDAVPHEIKMEYGTRIVFQKGPVQDGRNGDFIEDLLPLLVEHLKGVSAAVPSRETSIAITKLQEAWLWLAERSRARKTQGVQNTYKTHES